MEGLLLDVDVVDDDDVAEIADVVVVVAVAVAVAVAVVVVVVVAMLGGE